MPITNKVTILVHVEVYSISIYAIRKLDDTKGAIRGRESKNEGKYNDHKKKKTNNISVCQYHHSVILS